MAKPTTLPQQAWDNAADQAHLPTELPPIQPTQPPDVTLPHDASDHMPTVAVSHLPDWLII